MPCVNAMSADYLNDHFENGNVGDLSMHPLVLVSHMETVAVRRKTDRHLDDGHLRRTNTRPKDILIERTL